MKITKYITDFLNLRKSLERLDKARQDFEEDRKDAERKLRESAEILEKERLRLETIGNFRRSECFESINISEASDNEDDFINEHERSHYSVWDMKERRETERFMREKRRYERAKKWLKFTKVDFTIPLLDKFAIVILDDEGIYRIDAIIDRETEDILKEVRFVFDNFFVARAELHKLEKDFGEDFILIVKQI